MNDPRLPWSAQPPDKDGSALVLDCDGLMVCRARDEEMAQAIAVAALVAGGPRCCNYLPIWSTHFSAPVLFHRVDCHVPPPLTIRLLNGSLVSFSEGVHEPDLEAVFGDYAPDLDHAGTIPG